MWIAVWLVLSLMVGLLGIGRPGGFALYFILSVILSPLFSVLILLVTSANEKSGRRPQS